jgi:thioredoxin 1
MFSGRLVRFVRRGAAARVVLCLCCALVAAGCGSSSSGSATPRQTVSASPTAAATPIPRSYDKSADARADLAAALASSRSDGKPVLIDFGADWCPDCRVLGGLYQRPSVAPTLRAGYHLVLVDVGEFDHNLDVARQWGIDLQHSGIPALAVVKGGHVVYGSNRGEFANARTMGPAEVLTFLRRWA